MVDAYDMTRFGTANDTTQLLVGLNYASGGWFVVFLYAAIFVVLLFALMRSNPTPESVFAAALPGAVLSLVFWYYGMSSPLWIGAHSVVAAGALIAIYANRNG